MTDKEFGLLKELQRDLWMQPMNNPRIWGIIEPVRVYDVFPELAAETVIEYDGAFIGDVNDQDVDKTIHAVAELCGLSRKEKEAIRCSCSCNRDVYDQLSLVPVEDEDGNRIGTMQDRFLLIGVKTVWKAAEGLVFPTLNGAKKYLAKYRRSHNPNAKIYSASAGHSRDCLLMAKLVGELDLEKLEASGLLPISRQ